MFPKHLIQATDEAELVRVLTEASAFDEIIFNVLNMEMNENKYWVYILFSNEYSKFYIGQTNNLTERLYRHNSGFEKATKPYIPWELKLSLEKEDRATALKLEKKLKNLSKLRILQFIEKYGNSDL